MRLAGYLWALPNTLLAIATGLLLLGRFRLVDGVLEITGRRVAWALDHLPNPAAALTLGHAVFGIDQEALDRTRVHERVHVRQYERWGPLFVPAYLGFSAWLYARGRDGYLENPFEVEAYAVDDCRGGAAHVGVQPLGCTLDSRPQQPKG